MDSKKDWELRLRELEHLLLDPSLLADRAKWESYNKEYKKLRQWKDLTSEKQSVTSEIEKLNQILENEKDPEMCALAKDEIELLNKKSAQLEEEIQRILEPEDPNLNKNVILEVRAGAGGAEASLFAYELFRAYQHYAESHNLKTEILSISESDFGGYKEVIARVYGERAYYWFQFESGVHRVQRVPETEAQGRVHTSTVTVAIIPEQEIAEIKINPNDLRIETARSQGSGGQSVNRTESAVRVTHVPTGIIVFCQEGKSQHSNKERALQILYSKLVAIEEEKRLQEASEARLAQIKGGDRSDRIRTYNFPQSRVTDHRANITVHNLQEVLNGYFDEIHRELLKQLNLLKKSHHHA